MQGTQVIAGAIFALAIAACTGDDDVTLEARASGYLDFQRINARPFPTAQHQGNPLVNVWTEQLATTPYRVLSSGSAPVVEFPVGAMIVKEMMDASGEPPILTVMAKQPAGYDPAHGDWWYGRLEADGSATNANFVGRVNFCIGCHAGAPSARYVFGVAADNLGP